MREARFFFAGGFSGVGDHEVDGFIDGSNKRILVNEANLLAMVKGVLDVIPQVVGDREAIESALAIIDSPVVLTAWSRGRLFDVTDANGSFETWIDGLIVEPEPAV